MDEKILHNRKNGMLVLLLIVFLYVLSIIGIIWAASAQAAIQPEPKTLSTTILVICFLWLVLGWIPACGLKVLKPQEALVLTLFGNYIGTLKGAGFYYVNPFCTGVNPAAKTHLSQSGDVKAEPKEKQKRSWRLVGKKYR